MKKQKEKVYAKGFKGFEPGMTCIGKQYKENAVFEEETAEMCKKGMHFCENPLDVLNHYPLLNDEGELNEFADVEALAPVETEEDKSVTTKLRVGNKLNLKEFIGAAVRYILEKSKHNKDKIASENSSSLAASGEFSRLAASGEFSSLAASGEFSSLAASGNDSRLAATGESSQLVALGNYSQLVASGNYSQLVALGKASVITSAGDFSRVSASRDNCIAASLGACGVVKGSLGTTLVCAEWARATLICVKVAKVDGNLIKADTWYTVRSGKWVEVTN